MNARQIVRRSSVVGLLMVLGVAAGASVCGAQRITVVKTPKATYPLDVNSGTYSEISIGDLTYVGEQLWVLDRAAKKLHQIDPASWAISVSYDAPTLDPAGLAWDGAGLLVSDASSHVVYRLSPSNGVVAELVDLNECKTAENLRITPKDLPKLTALASDGTHLWAAFAAGYSSSIFKVDLETSTIVEHMWAKGPKPEGLSWDGTYLVAVDGRNGEARRIDVAGRSVEIAALPTRSATGLAYRAGHFMYFDPKKRQLVEIEWTP